VRRVGVRACDEHTTLWRGASLVRHACVSVRDLIGYRAFVCMVRRLWEFTYEYAEITGPRANLETNPCFGPFPYRYTWNVYIWQKVQFFCCLSTSVGPLGAMQICRRETHAWISSFA
jgi:hypothetical protein